MSAYFAHSRAGEPLETWHLLADHLEDTARKADALSSNVGLPGWGRAAGVLHDVGKYSIAFQARVRGNVTAVDHSTAGAQLSNSRYGPIGRLLAYVIAGHHGGVPNGINRADRADVSRTDLVTRLEKRVDDYAAHLDEIVAPATLDAPKLAFHPTGGRDRVGFSLSHATRMAFSCLVDADYLDTERFYADSIGRNVDRGVWPSLGQLARQLDQHMTSFEADTEVRRLRADILASARQSAGLAPGLFSMSVPTGGGKTLSSLVWALSHARTHNLNRVVYVIPYTSIIEQNAEVFRKALGPFANCVLEHHSVYEERGSDEGSTSSARRPKTGTLR